MRRSSIAHLALVAVLIAACGSTSREESIVASQPMTPGSAPQRVPLPRGFPVPAGAVPVAMPNDDPGLIGLWATDLRGSGAYDFYLSALPAGGYGIVGVYPGGAAAVIRFNFPGGAIWQVVTRQGPQGSVAIEVRLDRP
ncbi:MAG: hypothetical protein M3P32_01385 [Chloroflexota bacterium]|nr:hypothetical protein [Chloroflexota bacterium]